MLEVSPARSPTIRAVTFRRRAAGKEHQQRQDNAAHGGLEPWIGEAAEKILHHVHYSCEVQRHETAHKPETYDIGNTRDVEILGLGEEELELIAGIGICESGACDGCYQKRHHRHGGEVEHEHLEGEKHACDRGLEDAGDAGCGTTADKNHQNAGAHAELLAQIGAYGRTCAHDGPLGTHRTAEAYGDGAGQQGCVHVVPFQSAFVLRNRIEHTGYAMADVVAHHEAHI